MKSDDIKKIYGRDEEFRNDNKIMPFMRFPAHWYVQLIGPFGGATVRFRVSLYKDGKNSVSVYADLHERLGSFEEPHWELYPDADGDNARFKLNDVDSLFLEIQKSLDKTVEGES